MEDRRVAVVIEALTADLHLGALLSDHWRRRVAEVAVAALDAHADAQTTSGEDTFRQARVWAFQWQRLHRDVTPAEAVALATLGADPTAPGAAAVLAAHRNTVATQTGDPRGVTVP